MVDRIRTADEKKDVNWNIALALAHAGDADAALKTAQDSEKVNQQGIQEAIVVAKIKAQAENGDIKGALLATEHMGKENSSALREIADVQAESRDFAGARKTIDLIQDSDIKRWAQEYMDEAQARANVGRLLPSAEWIAKIDALLNHVIIMDLAEALKSLPKDNPQKTFNVLRDVAGELIDRQNVIAGMLKQQAKK